MAGLGRRFSSAAKAAVFVAVFCSFPAPIALGQVSLLATSGAGPQAETRDELDEVGLIYEASDPRTTVDRAEKFAQMYPTSEFLEAIELTKMDAYRELGRTASAVSSAARVLRMNPENPLALVSLAETLLSGGASYEQNRERAVQHARRAVSVLDSLAMPQGSRSREWLEAKKELLARAHGMLGYVHLKEEEFEEAAAELQIAAKLEPVGMYFYRTGLAFQFSGFARKASEAFERAIELGPEDVRRSAEERLSELRDQEP
jgi:tetratricopeptide (TPR) repeat protein